MINDGMIGQVSHRKALSHIRLLVDRLP